MTLYPLASVYGMNGGGVFGGMLAYIGFIFYIIGCVYMRQVELFVIAFRRDTNPISYWITITLFSIGAIWFGIYLVSLFT